MTETKKLVLVTKTDGRAFAVPIERLRGVEEKSDGVLLRFIDFKGLTTWEYTKESVQEIVTQVNGLL